MVSVVKNWWKAFFKKEAPRGYCFVISAMLKHACVTLHLPPPLTFTLLNNLPLFSIMVTRSSGYILAAFTAQKNPAAPPPMMISSFCFIQDDWGKGHGKILITENFIKWSVWILWSNLRFTPNAIITACYWANSVLTTLVGIPLSTSPHFPEYSVNCTKKHWMDPGKYGFRQYVFLYCF